MTFSFCCCCFLLGRLPPSSFLYWFCSQQFPELGSIHFFAFSARACSLAFLCLAILFLLICRAVFDLLIFFSKSFLSLVILLISVILRAHFFLMLLRDFSWVYFYRDFLISRSILSSTPYIAQLCLLRMHTINSCVGDT